MATYTSNITNVSLLTSGAIRACSIDSPQSSTTGNGIILNIAGWVLGSHQPILSVEAVHNGSIFCRMPVSILRQEVAKNHSEIQWAEKCGFRGQISTLGLPSNYRISLRAVLRGKTKSDRIRYTIAEIDGKHSHLQLDYSPKRQPLLITALGRSGTTWLMRLLSGDKEIAAAAAYPYELRAGVYWMHMLHTLSAPGNHVQSTSPDGFESNLHNIGSCPYHHPVYLNNLENGELTHNWLSEDYARDLGNLCTKSIDKFYDTLSGSTTDTTKYFMEKNLGGHIPWVYTNLYHSPKEIILIRDFRDTFCSSRAFNEKRGTAAFGKEIAKNDEEWIRNRFHGTKRLINSWKERKEQSFLLRYEDLILQPTETLRLILEYLDLEVTDQRIEKLLETASQDTPELLAHRTTKNPATSIGRWKNDMDTQTKELFHSIFGDILSELGYS